MSELDNLNVRSLSGVPMRPKSKAPVEPAPSLPIGELVQSIHHMANVLAENQAKLIDALTSVLPSKPVKASSPQTVGFSFERGPDNAITKGYVTNGGRSWDLTFTRRDGQVFVTAQAE